MEKRNIWKNVPAPLELHVDDRGDIVDVFYQQDIQHVAVIRSKKGMIRGHHFHRQTEQWMLILSGALEYWWKPAGEDVPWKMAVAEPGDLIHTPPNEIHALKIIAENSFMAFTKGLRGGMDYEKDTFRVKPEIF
jgi:dTDP-4-dehydrorhamnose 3,5-epimerase-like enzyme